MKIKNKISVIICTYNTKELTLKCLDDLIKSIDYLNQPVEVIVIENGTDGTVGQIRNKYPQVKLIEPGKNTGFAIGNNLGLEQVNSNSEFILLLNSDSLVEENTLFKSVEFMNNHPECSVLGCKLKFSDGKVQPSAGYLPQPTSLLMWMLGLDLLPIFSKIAKPVHPKTASFFSSSHPVEWVMGAYFFARKNVFNKTEGFDPEFFMYLEEVDLCKRIKDSGMQIWYTPDFSIVHLDKASSGGDLRKPLIREIQGLFYYIKKYYRSDLWWLSLIIKFGVLMRQIAFGFIGNKSKRSIYLEIGKNI